MDFIYNVFMLNLIIIDNSDNSLDVKLSLGHGIASLQTPRSIMINRSCTLCSVVIYVLE